MMTVIEYLAKTQKFNAKIDNDQITIIISYEDTIDYFPSFYYEFYSAFMYGFREDMIVNLIRMSFTTHEEENDNLETKEWYEFKFLIKDKEEIEKLLNIKKYEE